MCVNACGVHLWSDLNRQRCPKRLTGLVLLGKWVHLFCLALPAGLHLLMG